MKKDFLADLIDFCSSKTLENSKKLINVVGKIQDDISPIGMADALIHALTMQIESENKESFREVDNNIFSAILKNETIINYLKDQEVPYSLIGVTLMRIGLKYLTMENYAPELINKRIDEDNFSEKDMDDLMNSGLSVRDSDTAIKLAKHFNVYDEVMGFCKNEDECSCDSCTCKAKMSDSTLKTDKTVAIDLIEKNSMSAESIKQLLDTGDITIPDLVNGLSEKRFYEVMAAIHGVKETIKVDVKSDEEIMNKASERKKDLMSKALKLSPKERTALFEENTRDETLVTSEEKKIRRRVDAGNISDEEIVQAIKDLKLDPYYLSDNNKLPEKRLLKISMELEKALKPNISDLIDLIKKLGED